MNELIAQITQTNSSHYWVDLLLEKGVPAGPIYTMDEVFDDPQVRHLGIAADANTLPFGKTKLVGQPFTMNRTPSHIATHPPARGEHTEEILNELGINDFNQLRANNII